MLFSENMDLNMLFNPNDNKLFNKEEGLIKGNMFKDEYIPYKDYTPKKLYATDNKNEIKLKLYETYFAITDLNLYLDLNKDDNEIFETYKSFINEFNKYKEEYESIYGPLEITCITNKYDWLNGPYPFEDGGIKYV